MSEVAEMQESGQGCRRTMKQGVLDEAAGSLQPLKPIGAIQTWLCALHAYGHDLSRQVSDSPQGLQLVNFRTCLLFLMPA